MPNWTDDHARLLARATPPVAPAEPEEIERVWDAVRADTATPRLSSRRRWRVILGAGVAATAVGVGGVAAAGGFSAHTGRYPHDAEDLRLGGPGEYLDPAAPDYGEVIDQITGDIPFPDDQSRAAARDEMVSLDSRVVEPGETSTSTGALRFQVARAAVCAWSNAWVNAQDIGDRARVAQAADMLEQAPSWPAVTDVDAEQTSTSRWVRVVDAVTGERSRQKVVDDTPAGYFPLIRQAVAEGDRRALAEVLRQDGACQALLTPDFPRASGPIG